MKYKPFISSIFILFLSSCTFTKSSVDVRYDNYFSPWPNGQNYSTIIDSSNSFFKCTYDNHYDYCLSFKNGEKIIHSGTYQYVDESFVLEDGEEVIIIKRYNYYQFTEVITYDEKAHMIIWHAHHIFD